MPEGDAMSPARSPQSPSPTLPARRDFIKGVAAMAITAEVLAADQDQARRGDAGQIPQRPLGKTGVKVSCIGLGGHTFATTKDHQAAIRLVREAIDAGITFMDNAWDYHNGKSEEWMGDALKDGYRDKVFLMTKVCTHERGKDVAMKQLEESLKRLKTDHLDLWQIHEVVYWNSPELNFRKGGAVEALEEAKKQGKVRFVGFTGHKHPEIHLKMLSYKYPFDACQLPLNCFDAVFKGVSFEESVLPELHKQGIAPVGMKSLGGTGEMVKRKVVTAQEALRYAMSLPVAVTVSGIDKPEILQQNLAVARGFKPMSSDEMKALRERVSQYATDGRFELYKVTANFEGKEGRQQHGFPA
jgi:aryl-alcohol dehydrogenase-like predicted oxidoreductase